MIVLWHSFMSSVLTQFKLTVSRPIFQVVLVCQPIVMAVISYMIYTHTGSHVSFASFVVLGSGISGIWASTVYSSAGEINRERFYGTLGTLISVPTPLSVILAGKILTNGLLSLVSLGLSFLFSFTILRVSLQIAHPWAFALEVVLFLLATNFFALSLSSLFLLSRSTTVMQNFLEYPILIVSSVFFAPNFLPLALQIIGWPIPLTWGARALSRTFVAAWDTSAFLQELIIQALLTLLYLGISLLLFRLIVYRVRITASLEVY